MDPNRRCFIKWSHKELGKSSVMLILIEEENYRSFSSFLLGIHRLHKRHVSKSFGLCKVVGLNGAVFGIRSSSISMFLVFSTNNAGRSRSVLKF